MDKKGIGRKLTPRGFLCMCILAAASAALAACSALTTAPPTTLPATAAPPTAIPATATPTSAPTLTPTATPGVVFNGQARVDLSALQDVALDALTNVHLDRADPVVLAGQINALAQFSVDTTFTVEPDGFDRAVLAYAGDGDVIIKLAGQDEEITDGSVRFFPQKNGAMIAARLQHNGGETGLDILDPATDRVMAYRKVEENGTVFYEITAEVNEAGQWVEYAGEQVKRYTESETVFAQAEVEAEPEPEPLDWRVAMSLMFNGYETVDSRGEIRQMPGYDFDHPVLDETDSEGTRFSIYCETTMYGDGQKPTIALSDELGGNATLVNKIKDWWRRYQAAYNQGMRGSKEGMEGSYITAIDPARLRQFSGETAPISPLREKGEGAPLREIPFDLDKVSRVIFLRGMSRSSKPIDIGDRFFPVEVDGERLDVYNVTATTDTEGNSIWTAMVFPDPEDLKEEKMILVFMNKGSDLQEGNLGVYGHLGGLVSGISYMFLPVDQVSILTNNALGGSGRSLEALENHKGEAQQLADKTSIEIFSELAGYYSEGKLIYGKR